MAETGSKISALTAITTIDSTDEVVVVDKSDTTAGVDGTNKKATKANFLKEYATLTGAEELTNKTLTSPVLKGTISGWIEANETWTYASASAPFFTFTVAGDVTGKYYAGMKIKLTQTTEKYFIIVKTEYSSPNTTISVYGGTDYTLANATITSPYYSTMKCPAGFPMSRDKWSITLATDSTTYGYAFSSGDWVRPTDNNTSGGNALADVTIPIGLWEFEANTTLSFVGDSTADDNFRMWIAICDSTTSSPSSTDIMRTVHITQQPSSNSPYSRYQGNICIQLRDLETYTSAKTKRVLIKNDGDFGTVTFVNNAGDAPNGTWFRWTCAYL